MLTKNHTLSLITVIAMMGLGMANTARADLDYATLVFSDVKSISQGDSAQITPSEYGYLTIESSSTNTIIKSDQSTVDSGVKSHKIVAPSTAMEGQKKAFDQCVKFATLAMNNNSKWILSVGVTSSYDSIKEQVTKKFQQITITTPAGKITTFTLSCSLALRNP